MDILYYDLDIQAFEFKFIKFIYVGSTFLQFYKRHELKNLCFKGSDFVSSSPYKRGSKKGAGIKVFMRRETYYFSVISRVEQSYILWYINSTVRCFTSVYYKNLIKKS